MEPLAIFSLRKKVKIKYFIIFTPLLSNRIVRKTGFTITRNFNSIFIIPLEHQPNNPLHGIRLDTILEQLVAHYGWEELGERITIRCFTHDPSIKSSLKFLRKTPWARERVEGLYLKMQRDMKK